MAQLSTVELHPDRGRIEYELGRGVPVKVVARKYQLSHQSLYRYLRKMPAALKAGLRNGRLKDEELERLKGDESEGLLQNLANQRARLLLAQDRAADLEQLNTVSQIAGQIHKNLELVGKLLELFAQHSVQTSVSILIQPEYLELRSALLRALQPFPEARRAVATALHQVEGRAAALPQLPSPPPAPVTIDAIANTTETVARDGA